jgi:hypothetical protein
MEQEISRALQILGKAVVGVQSTQTLTGVHNELIGQNQVQVSVELLKRKFEEKEKKINDLEKQIIELRTR